MTRGRLRRRRRAAGQSFIEYLILVCCLVLALAGIFAIFPRVLEDFCGTVLMILGLPIL
jgi:hypothetical protein